MSFFHIDHNNLDDLQSYKEKNMAKAILKKYKLTKYAS